MDTAYTSQPPPQEWLDALERARADVAAGRTYDFDTFVKQLGAEDIADMAGNEHGSSAAE